MTFLDSYKKLDNLCKNILNSTKGVSSYITQMESCRLKSTRAIKNWEADYKALKHYRYIRNCIVHDDGASESALCSKKDIMWLNDFTKRMLNKTDPLAQYQKKVNKGKPSAKKISEQNAQSLKSKRRKKVGIIYCIVIALALCLAAYVAVRFFIK